MIQFISFKLLKTNVDGLPEETEVKVHESLYIGMEFSCGYQDSRLLECGALQFGR
jgi:hypothetical protein